MSFKDLFGLADHSAEPGGLTTENEPRNPSASDDYDIVWLKRMLSHNVRMPMAVITGYGELIRQGLLNPEEKDRCIMGICENITYMNQVLKVVLDDEEDSFSPTCIDIVELAGKMKGYVDDIARKIPIRIEIKAALPQMYIFAESIPVMKIFYQLFDNSFKYLKKNDQIQISIFPVEDERTMVVFKDNGPGVSQAELPFIFQKGYRASNKGNRSGSGFGLYVVKSTVEKYGGTVTAQGDYNKGLSIVMLFPNSKNQEKK